MRIRWTLVLQFLLSPLLLGCAGAGGGEGNPPGDGGSVPSNAPSTAQLATRSRDTIANSSGISLPVYGLSTYNEGSAVLRSDGSLQWKVDGLVDRNYAPSELVREDALLVSASDATSALELWNAVRDTNGELHYARFGMYLHDDGTNVLVQPWHFGRETPTSRIPTSGFAGYAGLTRGVMVDANGVYDLHGAIQLLASFQAGHFDLNGQLYDLVATDADGATYEIRQIPLTGGRDRSAVPNAPQFSGTLNGNFVNGDSSVVGGWSGRFFGPAAEELAGVWNMTGATAWAVGSFGARSESSSHPSGPWSGATLYGTSSEPIALTTSVRNYRFDTDKKVVSSTAVASTAAHQVLGTDPTQSTVYYSVGGINRQVRADPDILYSYPVQAALTEKQYLLTPGIGNDLTYTTFGYWADNIDLPGLQSRWHFFHGGRETPLSQIPTSGRATYLGSMYGAMAFREFSHRGTEFGSIGGSIALQVDFGTRTLTGSSPGLGFTLFDGTTGGFGGTLALTGTVTGNGFSGTTAVTSTAPTVPSASGTFSGKFYGPNAREAGGLWNFASSDGRLQAQGAFGARLDRRE